MDKTPWIAFAVTIAGWIWHAAIMWERLHATRREVRELKDLVGNLMTSAIAGRRRLRVVDRADDRGVPAK